MREKRLKKEERLFREKCDEVELKFEILCLEFKLSALSNFNFNQFKMPVTKTREPMPTLTCEIADFSFNCKYREHQNAIHVVKAEELMLDKSVDVTHNGDTSEDSGSLTSVETSQDLSGRRLNHFRKANGSMDARPYSTLSIIQTCPLEEGGKKDKNEGAAKRSWRGKRGRGGNGGNGSTRHKSVNGGSEHCINQGNLQSCGQPQPSHHHQQLHHPPPHHQVQHQYQQPHQPFHRDIVPEGSRVEDENVQYKLLM